MKADSNQQTAITLGTGPALISAGPGSGKTFVLIRRIRYLITHIGIPPGEILVLTFSKAAAEEMKHRFRALMREESYKSDINQIYFGTFHALFYRILVSFNTNRKYTILSEKEEIKLMKAALEKCKCRLTNTEFASELLGELSSFKAKDYPLHKYTSKHMDSGTFRRIVSEYERSKEKSDYLDFDDILTKTRDYLYRNPEELKRIQKRFKYILIDEFQDINPIQYEVISMIADVHRNIFAVGDDDQSIYAFRGANPVIMQEFLRDYPDCRHIVLSVNYRSGSNIVKKAGKLIKHNKNRIPKEIVSGNHFAGTVTIKHLRNEESEYRELVHSILKVDRSEYPDSAIMLRTNHIPAAMLLALHEKSIPVFCRENPKETFGPVNIYNVKVNNQDLNALRNMNFRDERGIRIITMHSSKGLEYLNVWITDVCEGNIPIRQAKTEDEIEEERRLFYVAVTRAKKCLTIYGIGSYRVWKNLFELYSRAGCILRKQEFTLCSPAHNNKKTEQHTLSRFFREIK